MPDGASGQMKQCRSLQERHFHSGLLSGAFISFWFSFGRGTHLLVRGFDRVHRYTSEIFHYWPRF